MSNAVFPSEIGQDVNGLDKWSFRLPIKKTPSYKTLVQTPANNMGEVRVSLTLAPIWIFNLDLAFMRGDFTPAQVNSAVQQIVGFYGQMQGMADDWLYFDPWDNGSNLHVVTPSAGLPDLFQYQFGVGDGTTTIFQMSRTIGGMVDYVQNFVNGFPLVYDGVSLVNPTDYTLSTEGIITFNTPPVAAAVLTWYGQFYFRCRFLDDEWADLQSFRYLLWSNPQFRFKSILV